MKTVRHYIRYWTPIIAYALLIFILSAHSRFDVPEPFFHLDKLYHFLLYSGLGFLLARPLRKRGLAPTLVVILAGILAGLYGLTDEYHQIFVPEREASIVDLFFDLIGGFAGALIYLYPARKVYDNYFQV